MKKVIDETTGLAMSREAGKVFDDTNVPMRNLCVKKGMQVIQLPAGEKEKLKSVTMPIRDQWVKDMTQRGLSGQAILDAAVTLTTE